MPVVLVGGAGGSLGVAIAMVGEAVGGAGCVLRAG